MVDTLRDELEEESLTRISIAATALFIAFDVAAAEVAFLPVQGTNLTHGEATAIGMVMANAFATETRKAVTSPSETAEAIAGTGNVTAALTALGASQYVEVTAVQLKTRITIHAGLFTSGGALLHQAELTAASLDDVEPIARRIARALVQRTTAADTREIDTVTEREGQRPNRVFVGKALGVKTGMTWPYVESVRFDPSVSIQFDGRLEGEQWFLEFGAGALIPTAATDAKGFGGIFAEIGGSFYLVKGSASPYLGAGLRPGLMFTSSDGGAGLGVYGQAGLMLMREYRTRLYFEFRVTQNLVPFHSSVSVLPGSPATSTGYYPTELALQAGLGW